MNKRRQYVVDKKFQFKTTFSRYRYCDYTGGACHYSDSFNFGHITTTRFTE